MKVRSLLDASNNDPHQIAQVVLLLFITRNTRGGKGEKKLAYDMFLAFAERFPETAEALLALFPLYGYWKDLLSIMVMVRETRLERRIHTAAYRLMKEHKLLNRKDVDRSNALVKGSSARFCCYYGL